jgi:FixJ family two-component response regulator
VHSGGRLRGSLRKAHYPTDDGTECGPMSKLRDNSKEAKEAVVRPWSGDAAEMSWVLIVEDHALFREGLALLLKWRTGLDNIQSGSIDEARRILGDATEEPVCAVVDLDLPDWVELLERLRGLPVVALVSDRSLERCVLALEAGADEVLHKGESSEKIQSVVEQFVGGLRTRENFSD